MAVYPHLESETPSYAVVVAGTAAEPKLKIEKANDVVAQLAALNSEQIEVDLGRLLAVQADNCTAPQIEMLSSESDEPFYGEDPNGPYTLTDLMDLEGIIVGSVLGHEWVSLESDMHGGPELRFIT